MMQYNPSPIIVDPTSPAAMYIADLRIVWTAEYRVSAGSAAQGSTYCSGSVSQTTATLTFTSCSFYPDLQQYSRTIELSLTDEFTEYSDSGCYLLIQRPTSTIAIPLTEVEPYLAIFDDQQNMENTLPSTLNSSDTVTISATDTGLAINADIPLVLLPEQTRISGIRCINGITPVNGDITITGIGDTLVLIRNTAT